MLTAAPDPLSPPPMPAAPVPPWAVTVSPSMITGPPEPRSPPPMPAASKPPWAVRALARRVLDGEGRARRDADAGTCVPGVGDGQGVPVQAEDDRPACPDEETGACLRDRGAEDDRAAGGEGRLEPCEGGDRRRGRSRGGRHGDEGAPAAAAANPATTESARWAERRDRVRSPASDLLGPRRPSTRARPLRPSSIDVPPPLGPQQMAAGVQPGSTAAVVACVKHMVGGRCPVHSNPAARTWSSMRAGTTSSSPAATWGPTPA